MNYTFKAATGIRYFLFILIYFAASAINVTFSQELTLFAYDTLDSEIIYSDQTCQSCHADSLIIVAHTRQQLSTEQIPGNIPLPEDSLIYLAACWKNPNWYISKLNFNKAGKHLEGEKAVVVFVHGDGKDFKASLRRAMDIQVIFNVKVIAFDYPSRVPELNRIKNFYNSRKNVAFAVPAFKGFLDSLNEFKIANPNTSINLELHSLGNHMLMNAVKKYGSRLASPVFDNVLLNAPAVPQKGHYRWLDSLNIQKRIYLTYNKKDHTLNGARLITFRKQLGERLHKKRSRECVYVNFRNIAPYSHNYYRDVNLFKAYPSVRLFYETILNGREVNTSADCFKKREDCNGYDIR